MGMRLIVRTDASPKIGAGHFMRSSAIIEESINRGLETFFAGTVIDMPWVENRLQNIKGLKTIEKLDDFESNKVSDILLLDSYHLPLDDKFINPTLWRAVVTLVDEFTPPYKSNLKIHPGLSAPWLLGTDILHGPDYIPIRKKKRVYNDPLNDFLRVVIVGGGTDLLDFGNTLATALAETNLGFEAIVLSERPSPTLSEDSRFQFRKIGLELDELSQFASLIITTASTTSMEFIAAGKAIGVLCGVRNQETYYQTVTEIGLAAPLGKYSDGEWKIDSTVMNKLLTDQNFRENLQSTSDGFIDGKGAARIIDKIIKLQPN